MVVVRVFVILYDGMGLERMGWWACGVGYVTGGWSDENVYEAG